MTGRIWLVTKPFPSTVPIKAGFMNDETEMKIIQIIALMKSNFGSSQSWAQELEKAIGIEPIIINQKDQNERQH